jgi:hypothetical protein
MAAFPAVQQAHALGQVAFGEGLVFEYLKRCQLYI